jgi:hypothetical protein
MSRRHHGGRPHRQNGHARGTAPAAPTQASPRPAPHPVQPSVPSHAELNDSAAGVEEHGPVHSPAAADPAAPPTTPGVPEHQALARDGASGPNRHDAPAPPAPSPAPAPPAGCTAPQLRRFIKSRPYVPMHELRRRFGINGSEDDVTSVQVDGGQVFVGLPTREGGLLGELLRGGEVGYELSLDPRSPIVVGLYPMRPVPRS